MAKKLSTLVIDATVNTSGVDKAVSTINNKLKNVKGSGGGSGRDGRFSAGINPLAYVGGSGGDVGNAFAGALGAAAVLRGQSSNIFEERRSNIRKFGIGSVFHGSKVGSSFLNMVGGMAGAYRAYKRGDITHEYGKYFTNSLIDEHERTRESFNRLANARGYSTAGLGLQVTGRALRMTKKAYPTAFSSPFAGLKRGMTDLGGLGSLIGTGGLVAGAKFMTNFRQNVYGQFNDLDQFVGSPMFDAAKGLRNTGFANKSGQRTLTQSLMLGARSGNPNKPSILETGGGGIQDYYNNMFMGLGAFISDPLDTVGQAFVPGSPLRQMAGEDPKNLGWFASIQASLFGTYQASRRNSV